MLRNGNGLIPATVEMNEWTIIRQHTIKGTLKIRLIEEMPVDFEDRLVLGQLANMLGGANTGTLWITKKYKDGKKQQRLKIYLFNDGIEHIKDACVVTPERLFEAINMIGCFKSEIFRPKGSKYEKVIIQ